MELHVRQYLPDDENAVIFLWQKCNLTRSWNNPKMDIERKTKDSPGLFFVGEIDGSIVSSAMAGYDGHRGWVYYLAVDPDYRKQGFGRKIMTFVEEKLKDIGCPKIDLMVRINNNEVVQFYNKIGYGQDEVVTMSKRLITDNPYQ